MLSLVLSPYLLGEPSYSAIGKLPITCGAGEILLNSGLLFFSLSGDSNLAPTASLASCNKNGTLILIIVPKYFRLQKYSQEIGKSGTKEKFFCFAFQFDQKRGYSTKYLSPHGSIFEIFSFE